MEFWQAMALAFIEGVTEYLPVSSTGHMILASSMMGVNDNAFVKDYVVIVQFGAILAVLALYLRRFAAARRAFYSKILIAFLPAAAVGFAAKKKIDAVLGNPAVVAIALIVGGAAMIVADRWLARRSPAPAEPEASAALNTGSADAKAGSADAKAASADPLASMSFKQAVAIGFAQCFAFVPGVSRSAATILGGLWQRLSRRDAAEFSFFLGVPTLTAATAYKLLKIAPTIEREQIGMIVVGNALSFLVAIVAIRFFIELVSRKGFAWFGAYRIALGLLVLVWIATGRPVGAL